MENTSIHSLIRQKANALNTFAYYLYGNSVEALKLVDHCFQLFFTKYDQFPEEEREVNLALFHLALNHLKKRRPRNLPQPQIFRKQSNESLLEHILTENEELYVLPGFQKILRSCVIELATDLKIPLLLRDTFSFSIEDIGGLLNIPKTTVDYRISQARGQLLNALRCEQQTTLH